MEIVKLYNEKRDEVDVFGPFESYQELQRWMREKGWVQDEHTGGYYSPDRKFLAISFPLKHPGYLPSFTNPPPLATLKDLL